MPDIQLRNVLLDTQVYFRARFAFKDGLLARISSLAAAGVINLLITNVNVEEIKTHLKGVAREICEGQAKFLRQAKALPNHFQDSLPSLWSCNEIARCLEAEFMQFLETCRAEILSCDQLNLGPILQDYFAGRAPFGLGKKKCEFPDAASIAAVRAWSESNHADVYVVSEDSDITSSCTRFPRLLPVGTGEKFLDLLASDDEALAHFTRHQIVLNFHDLKVWVREVFEEMKFSATDKGVYLSLSKIINVDLIDTVKLLGPIQAESEASIPLRITYRGDVESGYASSGYTDEPDDNRGFYTITLDYETNLWIKFASHGLRADRFKILEIDLGDDVIEVDVL